MVAYLEVFNALFFHLSIFSTAIYVASSEIMIQFHTKIRLLADLVYIINPRNGESAATNS